MEELTQDQKLKLECLRLAQNDIQFGYDDMQSTLYRSGNKVKEVEVVLKHAKEYYKWVKQKEMEPLK